VLVHVRHHRARPCAALSGFRGHHGGGSG
jgi:hypothetical protein